MKKCCLKKYLKKKPAPNQQQPQSAQGYPYGANSYSYYNYSYAPQQQSPYYQTHPQYNYNYGWTAYPNSNTTQTYGYTTAPAPIIYEIRDRSPSDDETYEHEHRRHRRSRSTRRDKSVANTKSVSRIRPRVVPAGPPPPPKLLAKSDKNSTSADEYRPVYSPNEKVTLAQYSDNEPSEFGAGYHQSSIEPQSDILESGSEALPSETDAPPENIAPPTPDFTRSVINVEPVSVQTPTLSQAPILVTSVESTRTTSPSTPVQVTAPALPATPIQTPPPTRPLSSQVFSDQTATQVASPQKYSSEIERAIHTSNRPIEPEEAEFIEIPELGIKGFWINKSETEKWKGGEVPLSDYKINLDSNPEVIPLKYAGCVERIEAKAVKFLKPLQIQPPGDLVITQLPDYQPPEAPPIIVRQLAPEHCDPKPQVIRERPPVPPEIIPSQEIIIPGKRLDPPPRRVIVEKLAKEPDEIKGITVERWLPYERQQRRVVFNRAPEVKPIEVGHNIEYVWESPCVEQRTEFQNLGVEYVDPAVYLGLFFL